MLFIQQFASYLGRVLCKTRLTFPRINGPYEVHASRSFHSKSMADTALLFFALWSYLFILCGPRWAINLTHPYAFWTVVLRNIFCGQKLRVDSFWESWYGTLILSVFTLCCLSLTLYTLIEYDPDIPYSTYL